MKVKQPLWVFCNCFLIVVTGVYAQTAFTTGRGNWQEAPLKNEHLKEKTTEKPKQDAEKPQPFENREPPEILPQTTALPKPEETDKKNTQTVSDSESDSDPDQTLPDRDPDLNSDSSKQEAPQALDVPRGRTQDDPPDTEY